jgi:CheY-like chemotaxis protein
MGALPPRRHPDPRRLPRRLLNLRAVKVHLTPSRGRVLLIEDDEEVTTTLMEILVELGYEVSAAADAQQGLSLVPIFRPDVILLDLTMPGMSGFEALPHFRRHHPTRPVIVVTSNIEPEIEELVRRKGAFGFVGKPFDMAALDQLIRAAMGTANA